MKGIIASNCNPNNNPHTKVGACAMFEGTPSGLIFTHKDGLFSTEKEAFNLELADGVYAPGINRVIPVSSGIVALGLNGGDLKTSQEGFGPESPVGLNALREDYTITAGGICLYKQLTKLDKRQVRLFKVDQTQIAYGTVATIGGEDKMRGYLVTVGVSRRINTGEASGAIILSLFYDANFQNEDINGNSIPLTETIEGLTGIILRKGSAAGKASVIVACSGDDLTATYGTEFAEATLYEQEDGTNPTTVTYLSGELTIAPAGKYKIVDALTLKGVGIEGYEGEEEYVNIA